MSAAPQKDKQPDRLVERIENHRKEIQFLIKQGGEQPSYEFKRTVSLVRETLEERLDFIKLFQALANNTDIAGERCIIIGADPKAKKFFPLANADEFDPANLRKILGCCPTFLPAPAARSNEAHAPMVSKGVIFVAFPISS